MVRERTQVASLAPVFGNDARAALWLGELRLLPAAAPDAPLRLAVDPAKVERLAPSCGAERFENRVIAELTQRVGCTQPHPAASTGKEANQKGYCTRVTKCAQSRNGVTLHGFITVAFGEDDQVCRCLDRSEHPERIRRRHPCLGVRCIQ
jgi:hypothetical protein